MPAPVNSANASAQPVNSSAHSRNASAHSSNASAHSPSEEPAQDAGLRARLVEVGAELLAREGVQALSLREIARRAGVSHGAPRRYFPTHQALLAAIAREGYRHLATLVDATIGRPGL